MSVELVTNDGRLWHTRPRPDGGCGFDPAGPCPTCYAPVGSEGPEWAGREALKRRIVVAICNMDRNCFGDEEAIADAILDGVFGDLRGCPDRWVCCVHAMTDEERRNA